MSEVIENTIANINDGSNYNMVCVKCGCYGPVHLIAHRNPRARICGFIVSCDNCSKDLANKKVYVQEQEKV